MSRDDMAATVALSVEPEDPPRPIPTHVREPDSGAGQNRQDMTAGRSVLNAIMVCRTCRIHYHCAYEGEPTFSRSTGRYNCPESRSARESSSIRDAIVRTVDGDDEAFRPRWQDYGF